MDNTSHSTLFDQASWYKGGHGPRYEQLYRHISAEIATGRLGSETQLPPERDLAALACVSRVTVRKAVSQLVAEGLLDQRRGAGTFVRPARDRMEPYLSKLLSFTEYMQQRGKTTTAKIIKRGIFNPTPDEQLALGLSAIDRVARIERVRAADGVAMAVEWSSLPPDILPDPEAVGASLYDVLRSHGTAPTRAVQRITAVNLPAAEAHLLNLPENAAVLRIDRTGFLPSGRPIEFTRGLYRSEIYDFVAELRLEANL